MCIRDRFHSTTLKKILLNFYGQDRPGWCHVPHWLLVAPLGYQGRSLEDLILGLALGGLVLLVRLRETRLRIVGRPV